MSRKPLDRARPRSGPLTLQRNHLARRVLAILGIAALLPWPSFLVFSTPEALAASVASASFSGGAGTVTVGGALYAKSGGALTLTVNTSTDTKCVEITGAHTARQTSATAKASWTFAFTAGAGEGVQNVNLAASPDFNANNCTGKPGTGTASYILDNTGPVVTATKSPAANGAGWNNSTVAIAWSAADPGSGLATGPTPATDSVTANFAKVTKTSTATDRLGNRTDGSVTVSVDKNAPSITGNRTPAANTNGWNNTDVAVDFTCDDPNPSTDPNPKGSGVKSCVADGTTPASASKTVTTEGLNQSVSGTATDNADNTAKATVGGINIDKTAPTLSGAPVGQPTGTSTDANGNPVKWYNGDVAIAWTADDARSGLAGLAPPNSTIKGEGTGLFASASVSDKAGNTTTADSAKVNIDRTAPSTDATAPTGWTNKPQTVTLAARDALSGVKATHYILDPAPGAVAQTGTSVAVAGDGLHTLEYWSEDNAGNVEAHKTVQVKIDGTSPTISHTQSPAANANGWNNANVTVHFVCSDALSGIASCTADQVVSTEGKDQTVKGTATDNAGNTAGDPASVSIDKTAPTVSAAADRAPNTSLAANGKGWYDGNVTVSFTCGDALSGIDTCPAAQTLGEGYNQSATGTAKDAAGNSASDGVTGVNVDKTAPTLLGHDAPKAADPSQPNAAGWYRGDVTIHWTCGDPALADASPGSGVDGPCPADDVISGEGRGLETSAAIADKAGNTTVANSPAVNIDRSAPTTSASVPPALESGWYAGDVQVTLNASDGLSGVDTTYYSVDGGAAQVYTGPFAQTQKGSHTISFWSVDKAGNVEDKTVNSITLKIDGVPPTVTGKRSVEPNANGWNNTPVDVTFDCTDAESGIALCAGNSRIDKDTAAEGTTVTGNATDNAGNTAEAVVGPVKVDMTAPDLSGSLPDPSGIDAAGAKWYTGDTAVTWVCSDGLSGIAPEPTWATNCPPNSTITGEGRNLGAGPVSVSDKAGNSTSASVSGVNIDRNGPTISKTVSPSPNAAGWYSGAVKVDFTCQDPALADGSAGSAVAACPSTIDVTSEGAGQSVTSAAARDYAGNSTPGVTAGGINIDNTAPVSKDTVQCTLVNGFCNGSSPVSVTITADDQVGLSGVKEIRYTLDGGTTWKVATGASVTFPVTLPASGQATVKYYAVDKADNAEAEHADSINYDGTAPKVSHTLTPAANAADWSNADTLVHFSAQDDPGGSGVSAATVTADKTYTAETAGQTIVGGADDVAGNHGTDSFTFKLDKTAPQITATRTPAAGNANGWNNKPVTVSFACSDPNAANGALGSGVPAGLCPDPVTLSGNNVAGQPQTVTRSVSDLADNKASAGVTGINIDMESPTVTINGPKDDGVYTLGAVPAPSCTAGDDYSGLDGACKTTLTGGLPNGVGTFTYTATATDKAGNTTTKSVTYSVRYSVPANVPFFLQPINDTAHTASTQLSIFKAGSTVPVKFQLRKADGTVVQANSAPTWLAPVQGNLMTGPVTEGAFSAAADTTSTFRWSATDQQYIYNWGTSATQAQYYWKIGVKLDDGQTVSTYIGLRR